MDIREEFNKRIGELTDEQFWKWVRGWFDEQLIMDIINEWEDDIKKNEIENLDKILMENENTDEEN